MNSDLPVTIYSCIFGSSTVVVFLPKSGIYTTLKVVCTTLVVFGAVNSFHQGRQQAYREMSNTAVCIRMQKTERKLPVVQDPGP